MSELSLYHIDQTLQQLLDYRAERMADTVDPPGDDEVSALDGEIRKYLEQLPAKVDGVAAILRMFKGRHENIKAEISRLKALDESVCANEERLKSYVAEILERQPLPKKGPRKLCGATSELRLVGNGGLAPLKIQEDILPNEYRTITVKMALVTWLKVPLEDNSWVMGPPLIAPDNAGIRSALAAGVDVPGAHLEERSSRVEVK